VVPLQEQNVAQALHVQAGQQPLCHKAWTEATDLERVTKSRLKAQSLAVERQGPVRSVFFTPPLHHLGGATATQGLEEKTDGLRNALARRCCDGCGRAQGFQFFEERGVGIVRQDRNGNAAGD